jgi:acyloxyacyl hydrolase
MMFEVLNFLQKQGDHYDGMDLFGAVSAISKDIAGLACNDALNFTCDVSRITHHLPLADGDNDYFAGDNALLGVELRGTTWRGKDCDDTKADVYPGRQQSEYGADVDHNCNGISGGNSTGSYEDLFCSGEYAPRGIAILGDSATAHFHIPPQYINEKTLDFSHIIEAAANELDWPACSWSTGYHETDRCPASVPLAPMNSIYQRLRERNLCMHRDFQNIGVNGARVGSMADGIIQSFARDQTTDTPLLVFHALIGNDVCNGHPGAGHMTTPDAFRASVLQSLAHLDAVLPPGSHVAFIPLADGRVLYETTHNLTHPLGVGYPDMYEYLSCSGLNPCWGWLNTNATWRDFTSQRAALLSEQYNVIMGNHSYNNFDMHMVTIDWPSIFSQYIAAGGNPRDLVEPVDGFHPSQAGQQLLAGVVWDDLMKFKPQWLGPENPHNDEIRALFGDQGGY